MRLVHWCAFLKLPISSCVQYFVVSARILQSLIVTVLQCRIVSAFMKYCNFVAWKLQYFVVDCNELARFTLFLQTEDIFSHLDSLKAKRSGILETLTAIKQKIMEVESQQTEAVREVGSKRLYAFISGAWWMLSCILRFLCPEVSLPQPLQKMFCNCKNRGTN